ncbi:MAG: UvrD-helicase domain-containing protein [Paludibacteraceae bacterium]|nr:UvrD-helicase domain-containing protein [Paludibacteraceae bacterium]
MTNGQNLIVRQASAGSGKTYNLAAYYVSLLLSGVSYRNILAVTFTNDATNEMKQRILGYLYDIAQYHQWSAKKQQETQAFVNVMIGEGYLSKEKWDASADGTPALAMRLYEEITDNLDHMHISTIDSFLQSLLSGMIQLLGQSAGYSVELDAQKVINEAVETILTTGIEQSDGNLTERGKRIERYMNELMDKGKNWNMSKSLSQTSEELYKEQVQVSEKIFPNAEEVDRYKKALWTNKMEVQTLIKMLNSSIPDIDSYLETKNGTLYATGSVNEALQTLKDVLEGKTDVEEIKLPSAQTKVILSDDFQKQWRGSASDANIIKKLITNIASLLPKVQEIYLTYKTSCQYLNDLMLLGDLQREIDTALRTHNVRMLADSAKTLHKALKPGDADFILEKAGIQYHYIMLDEFQDTSHLQWKCFLPLISEVLAWGSGRGVFIVGDPKQAIYRFRNGDANIMLDLPYFFDAYYNPNIPKLSKSFRSQREVVRFNLETMRYISEMNSEYQPLYGEGYDESKLGSFHRADKQEGYVRLHMSTEKSSDIEHQENVAYQMFIQMEELMQLVGVKQRNLPSDMLVLVRYSKEMTPIFEAWNKYVKGNAEVFPKLSQTQLISEKSYTIESSIDVQIIMSALKMLIRHDAIAKRYLEAVGINANQLQSLSALETHMPLSALIDEIIRICFFADNQQATVGKDVTYLYSLMDFIHAFISSNGSNAEKLLRYWDEELHNKAVAMPSKPNGIQIMTIHKSKGLERANVFVPYCQWPLEEFKNNNPNKLWVDSVEVEDEHCERFHIGKIPVAMTSRKLRGTAYEPMGESECAEMRKDSLNMLYVTLTRAADRLFVWADYNEEKNDKKSKEKANNGPITVGDILYKIWKGYYEAGDKSLSEAETSLESDHKSPKSDENGINESTCQSKQVDEKPFDFKDSQTIEAQFHSENTGIVFQQSQKSMLMSTHGAIRGIEIAEQADKGTLYHDILAHIQYAEEMERVLSDYVARGQVANQEVESIRRMLQFILHHPTMASWFTSQYEIQREVSYLLPMEGKVEEVRPDRVMLLPEQKKAIVLDYKFGNYHHKYDDQVRQYAQIFKMQGYQVEGYLWMNQKTELIPVKV